MFNKGQLAGLMKQAQAMQDNMKKAQDELAKIEMARDAADKSKEELFDLRMKILQELDPFESAAAELQLHHLEHNRQVMEKHLKEGQ